MMKQSIGLAVAFSFGLACTPRDQDREHVHATETPPPTFEQPYDQTDQRGTEPRRMDPGTTDQRRLDPGGTDPRRMDPGTMDQRDIEPGTVPPEAMRPGVVYPDEMEHRDQRPDMGAMGTEHTLPPFSQIDINNDGVITETEISRLPAELQALLIEVPRDEQGQITRDSYQRFRQAH